MNHAIMVLFFASTVRLGHIFLFCTFHLSSFILEQQDMSRVWCIHYLVRTITSAFGKAFDRCKRVQATRNKSSIMQSVNCFARCAQQSRCGYVYRIIGDKIISFAYQTARTCINGLHNPFRSCENFIRGVSYRTLTHTPHHVIGISDSIKFYHDMLHRIFYHKNLIARRTFKIEFSYIARSHLNVQVVSHFYIITLVSNSWSDYEKYVLYAFDFQALQMQKN